MTRKRLFIILGLAALFFYAVSFPISVASTEEGSLKEKIISLFLESSHASISSLALTDPDVIDILKKISADIILEYRSNIPARVDRGKYLLHAKFALLDSYVIFGSMNFTKESLENALNDAIIFSDPAVIEIFKEIFDSIWKGKRPPGHYKCSIGEFYISPYFDIEKVVMELLQRAKKSVKIAMYAFTDRNVLSALKYLSSKGVKISLLLDSWSEKYIKSSDLQQFKHRFVKDTMLHHKFMIIDDKILLTGSANFTESGFRKNFEIVFVTTKKDIVDKYMKIFSQILNAF